MFNHINSSVSIDDVLSKTTVYDVLVSYLGITELPILINAPYRKDEKKSLVLYESLQKETILYKDFATGDTGDIFKLLSLIWRIDLREVYAKIYNELTSSTVTKIKTTRNSRSNIRRSSTDVKVQIRDWQQHDIEFWDKYGISLEWLKFGDVHPISYIVLIRDDGYTTYIKAEKYAYVYVERKDGNVTLKIYQPYSETMKWLSKHDSSVIDLWTKLPDTGDKLIITSSRKDALCTWSNTGIPCISLQGEGFIPKEKIVNDLKSRFKDIYVLFDNDFKSEENHGHIFATKLCELYDLKMLEIPEEYHEKDQSDFVKHYGRKRFKQLIYSLINK